MCSGQLGLLDASLESARLKQHGRAGELWGEFLPRCTAGLNSGVFELHLERSSS